MALLKKVAALLLLAVCILPILVYILLYFVGRFIWGWMLKSWFWCVHASRGRSILFVYSNSPTWQVYIEQNILPRIRQRAVVLNWSDRRQWPSSSPWEARFYYQFAGDREFNPLALVFCRFGRIRAVRFHQPFLDLKHGKETALRNAEAELFLLADGAE